MRYACNMTVSWNAVKPIWKCGNIFGIKCYKSISIHINIGRRFSRYAGRGRRWACRGKYENWKSSPKPCQINIDPICRRACKKCRLGSYSPLPAQHLIVTSEGRKHLILFHMKPCLLVGFVYASTFVRYRKTKLITFLSDLEWNLSVSNMLHLFTTFLF